MFNTIFPVLLGIIFVVSLLTASTTHRFRRIILFVTYGVLAIVYLALYLAYIRSPEYDSTLNYGLLFIGVMYVAQLLAHPILKRRAGPLVLRLRQLTPVALVGLISVPVLLLMFVGFLLPNLRSAATGMPIFDDYYFKSRLGMLLFLGPTILYLLVTSLQRTEFHERGIIQNSAFWTWAQFESYAWNETSNTSEVELILKPKIKIWRWQQVKFALPVQDKQVVENLLKKAYTDTPPNMAVNE